VEKRETSSLSSKKDRIVEEGFSDKRKKAARIRKKKMLAAVLEKWRKARTAESSGAPAPRKASSSPRARA